MSVAAHPTLDPSQPLWAHHDAQLAGGLGIAVVLLQRVAELAARDVARAHQEDVDATCVAIEDLSRIEQALHHLAEARELDAELQLEQRRRGIQMSLSAGRAGVLSSRTMSL